MATDIDGTDLPPAVAAYLEAYNRKDVDGMLNCLSPSVSFLDMSGDSVTVSTNGLEEFRALALAGADAFLSRTQDVRNAITVADTTVLEIAFSAVVARDLPNGWMAGQNVSLAGRSRYRVECGQIVEIIDVR